MFIYLFFFFFFFAVVVFYNGLEGQVGMARVYVIHVLLCCRCIEFTVVLLKSLLWCCEIVGTVSGSHPVLRFLKTLSCRRVVGAEASGESGNQTERETREQKEKAEKESRADLLMQMTSDSGAVATIASGRKCPSRLVPGKKDCFRCSVLR